MVGPLVVFASPSDGVEISVKVRLEDESVSLPAWERSHSCSISKLM